MGTALTRHADIRWLLRDRTAAAIALLLCVSWLPVDALAQPAEPGEGEPSEEPSRGEEPHDEGSPEGSGDEDEAPSAEEDESPPQPAHRPGLSPPRLLRSPAPHYPARRIEEGLHPNVVVTVTLDADGRVVEASVEHDADEEFATLAVEAVREHWAFAPAERDGVAIPSRIRVAVHFDLPHFDLASGEPGEPHHLRSGEPAPEPTPTPVLTDAEPHDHAGHEHEDERPDPAGEPRPLGVTAELDRSLRAQDRGASSYEIDRDVLSAGPRREGADLLLTVPGVFVARAEGPAVAHRIMLRGFDADHGQDIELRVGDLPVNLPSHIHGQGYADLGFLIPEVVQRVRATEGVYDPRQGDFAVAGTIDFDLGVRARDRGVNITSAYGSFNTFRQLLMWAPENEREETFGAVSYQHTDGFGQNRGGDVVSAIVQVGAREGAWRLRGLGIIHGARADLAGVVRLDDVNAGRVGFYDSYPVATAQAQNALSARFLGGFFGEYRGEGGDTGGLGVWLSGDFFRLQENFTGFLQRSRTLPGVAGRGDLIEQRNETFSVGLTGRYRTQAWQPEAWMAVRLELGLAGRLDFIEQSQNLLDASVRNQTWDRRVDAGVNGGDIGLYGDLDVQLDEYVHLRGGVRSTVLLYEVDDRLGNFVPGIRPEGAFIEGFRRSALGVAVGPRLSAEVAPVEWLSVRAAYGEGYRSPQARTLEDGEDAPFTHVRSADLGVVLSYERLLRVSVAGFFTELSDDVAFDAREGRLERIGGSRRFGTTVYATTRPIEWLVGALSFTYVKTELLEPPPATADNPNPPFTIGQSLPYVPPIVIRADLAAEGTLVRGFLDDELRGRIGVGYSFLSPRPLPYGGEADPVNLLDATAALGWGPIELGINVFNIFDTRYAATEFLFASNWDPTGIPDRVPTRHVAAGAPFTFMVTLAVTP